MPYNQSILDYCNQLLMTVPLSARFKLMEHAILLSIQARPGRRPDAPQCTRLPLFAMTLATLRHETIIKKDATTQVFLPLAGALKSEEATGSS